MKKVIGLLSLATMLVSDSFAATMLDERKSDELSRGSMSSSTEEESAWEPETFGEQFSSAEEIDESFSVHPKAQLFEVIEGYSRPVLESEQAAALALASSINDIRINAIFERYRALIDKFATGNCSEQEEDEMCRIEQRLGYHMVDRAKFAWSFTAGDRAEKASDSTSEDVIEEEPEEAYEDIAKDIKEKIRQSYAITEIRVVGIGAYMDGRGVDAIRKNELLSLLSDNKGVEKLLPSLCAHARFEDEDLKKWVSDCMRKGWRTSQVFRKTLLAYIAYLETKPYVIGACDSNDGQDETDETANVSVRDQIEKEMSEYSIGTGVSDEGEETCGLIFGEEAKYPGLSWMHLCHKMGCAINFFSAVSGKLGCDKTKTLIPALFGTSVDIEKLDVERLKQKAEQDSTYLAKLGELFKREFTDINEAIAYIQEYIIDEEMQMRILIGGEAEIWQTFGVSLLAREDTASVLLLNGVSSDIARNVAMKWPLKSSYADEKTLLDLGCCEFKRKPEVYDPLVQVLCDKHWDEYKKTMIDPSRRWWHAISDEWHAVSDKLSNFTSRVKNYLLSWVPAKWRK